MEGLSLSNTLSKGSVYESDSIYGAYLEDAASRLADGVTPEAISNEEIRKDDDIIQTYRVEDNAIHGGMGSVWRVRHLSWNTDLAMKRPQPRFFSEGSDQRKADFIAECEHWIDLGLHPNIVSCYYVRDIGGVPTIFSEWMDGGSLKDAINSGSLYEGTAEAVRERILDIAIQTARGLQYAHEQGLVHQDVKPGNILLTRDWEAKVADFGLAKAQSQLSDGEKPVSSGYTLAYCPGEQAAGAAAEAWMDIYAWALTVIEMAVGRRLWVSGAEAPSRLDDLETQARVALPDGMAALLRDIVGRAREFSFTAVVEACLGLYLQATGEHYPRVEPRAVGHSADHMSNYALSFLDLGREDQALALWEEAERVDGRCVSAVYNATLYKYRRGLMDNMAAIAAVKSLNDDSNPTPEALLALARIQRECRDPGLADTLATLERGGDGVDPEELARMRESLEAHRFRRIFHLDHGDSGPMDVSPDGDYLLVHARPGEGHSEIVTFRRLEDPTPISTLLREPDDGTPSEVRVRLSRNNAFAFGMYQKDPFVYKWRVADGKQVMALIMRKLSGEQIVAFSFDGRGEHGMLASNAGRVVFYDPVENRSKPFGSLQGHFGIDMSADGQRGLAFCTEENRILVRGYESGDALEIPIPQPRYAIFALEDTCVLAIQGGLKPEIVLFDVRTGERRYAVAYPLVHEFLESKGQFSASVDRRRLLLRVKKGYMLFDIAEHRWLFTIGEQLTGEHPNLVFRAHLTDTGSRVFLDSFGSGLTGYSLPAFTEDSPWSLSVIHTTREHLAEEDAFRACCDRGREAVAAGDIESGLGHLAEAAAVGAGKFRASEDYLSLVRSLSPHCVIFGVGDPLPLRRTRALTAPVSVLSVDPSGRWIAALAEDGSLALVDAASGETICRDASHRFAAFKPPRWVGERLFALVMGDARDEPIRIRDGQNGADGTMKISFMGQSLGQTEGGRIYAFDLSGFDALSAARRAHRFEDGAPAIPADGVTDFAIPGNGEEVLYRRYDGPVCRYSREKGTTYLLTVGDQCQISGIALSPDAATAVQLCGDVLNFSKAQTSSALAVFFDVQRGRKLYSISDGGITTACAFSGDGRWAVIGNEVFDLCSGDRRRLELDGALLGCFLDDRFLAGLDADGRLRVFGLEDGSSVRTADVGERPTALACSPDRNELYVGNARGELITLLWDHSYTRGSGARVRKAGEMYFWDNSISGGEPRETKHDHEQGAEVSTRAKRRGLLGLFGLFDRRNGR